MAASRRIVVGLADAGADPQLEHALRLAESVGAALHVVHGYHVPDQGDQQPAERDPARRCPCRSAQVKIMAALGSVIVRVWIATRYADSTAAGARRVDKESARFRAPP